VKYEIFVFWWDFFSTFWFWVILDKNNSSITRRSICVYGNTSPWLMFIIEKSFWENLDELNVQWSMIDISPFPRCRFWLFKYVTEIQRKLVGCVLSVESGILNNGVVCVCVCVTNRNIWLQWLLLIEISGCNGCCFKNSFRGSQMCSYTSCSDGTGCYNRFSRAFVLGTVRFCYCPAEFTDVLLCLRNNTVC
jgi:hypothetical protein